MRDVELLRSAGARISNAIRQLNDEYESKQGKPDQQVFDDVIEQINHRGLHMDWQLVRQYLNLPGDQNDGMCSLCETESSS
jgi:hypothetical protein